jgi:hypothetical protein
VDDRTELTIGYRLKDCQKMGIPIVIAFGKRAVRYLVINIDLSISFFRRVKAYVKLLMYTIIELNIYHMKIH